MWRLPTNDLYFFMFSSHLLIEIIAVQFSQNVLWNLKANWPIVFVASEITSVGARTSIDFHI